MGQMEDMKDSAGYPEVPKRNLHQCLTSIFVLNMKALDIVKCESFFLIHQ